VDRDEVRDSLHGVQQDVVRELERLRERRVLARDREEPRVRDGDERVHHPVQLLEPALRVLRPGLAFEEEGLRHHRDGERAHLAGHLGDHGRGARARPAAEARGDEHHVGAGEEVTQLVAVFRRRRAALLGVRAAAEPAGHGRPELDAQRCEAVLEGLRVRVRGDELHPAEAGADHRVEGVAATSADPDHLDAGLQPAALLELEQVPALGLRADLEELEAGAAVARPTVRRHGRRTAAGITRMGRHLSPPRVRSAVLGRRMLHVPPENVSFFSARPSLLASDQSSSA
jgi:hypothetical protein